MYGPDIIARTLTQPFKRGTSGRAWQYHGRSDRHSKLACWAIVFDLLQRSVILREQADAGTVVFGINHEMSDFRVNRKKNLDLVLCVPGPTSGRARGAFASLTKSYGIVLTAEEQRILAALPTLQYGSVGAVHVALEAKACMTAHQKALPRLYDELNSSHQAIHGSTEMAIAVGFIMVNAAERFVSSDLNKPPSVQSAPTWSKHAQPGATRMTVAKMRALPRRTTTGVQGFDAVGVVVVDCPNDGTPVRVVTDPQLAPAPGDIDHYDSMILRIAQLYESRFPRA